jgi:hypothetical protein
MMFTAVVTPAGKRFAALAASRPRVELIERERYSGATAMVTPWVPAMPLGCFGIRKSAVVAAAAEPAADSKPALPGRTAEAVSSTAARSPLRKALSNLRDWFCRTFCCAPCSGIQRSVSMSSPTEKGDVKPVRTGSVENAQKTIDRKPAASIELKGEVSAAALQRLQDLVDKKVPLADVHFMGFVNLGADPSALGQVAPLAKKGVDVSGLQLRGQVIGSKDIQRAGYLAQRGADVSQFSVSTKVAFNEPDLKETLNSLLLLLQKNPSMQCEVRMTGRQLDPQDSTILDLLQRVAVATGQSALLAGIVAIGKCSCESVDELRPLIDARAFGGLIVNGVRVTGSLDVESVESDVLNTLAKFAVPPRSENAHTPNAPYMQGVTLRGKIDLKSQRLLQVLALADSNASVKGVTVTGSETLAADDDEGRQLLERCKGYGMSLEMPGEHPPTDTAG